MKRVSVILGASGLVLALSMPSWAQTRELEQTIKVSGTVEAIDQAHRAVTVKTADGKFVSILVPESAKRFSELKVGNKVSVTYNNDVKARLKPAGEAAVDTAKGTNTMGQGDRPGGTSSVERTMTASISEIDKSASSITFVGPNGWKYSRHVVDPKVLDQVKVGDQVDITWNTDITITVE